MRDQNPASLPSSIDASPEVAPTPTQPTNGPLAANLGDGAIGRLSEDEREWLRDVLGVRVAPPANWGVYAVVERIVREHTERALAEVEQRIWAQSSCASLANTGYGDHEGCAVAESLRIVRAARQESAPSVVPRRSSTRSTESAAGSPTRNCPMHGERETFTAPHVGYVKEPGCTCTMLPSTPMTDATELDEAAIRARLEAARPGLPAAVARVAINRDGTCDGCAQSKHLVASYPEPDAEPWLCAECAADVDFVMFAPLDIGLLLTALDEAEFHIQQLTESRDRAERLAEAAEVRLDTCVDSWHDGRSAGPCPGCGYLRPQDRLLAAEAQVERLHFDLDREARARQAAEGALAAVRALADRWATEADDRGDDDLLYTRGVANMLDAALATPTTTEETR